MEHYGISKKTNLAFEEAIERVTILLADEGFGILTRIDVREKMQEKLEKDMENYVILGACHPPSAYEAIHNEIEIGLLLPCNVIVYEKAGEVFVSAIRPSVAMGFIDNPKVADVAKHVEESLQKIIAEV